MHLQYHALMLCSYLNLLYQWNFVWYANWFSIYEYEIEIDAWISTATASFFNDCFCSYLDIHL